MSLGWQGLMPFESGLFVRFNPMLHLGNTRIDANFDQLPNANDYYRLLNGTYANTSIRSASLSTEIAMGMRVPLSTIGAAANTTSLSESFMHNGASLIAQASFIPVHSRSTKVHHPSQKFSRNSRAVRSEVGVQWLSNYQLNNQPLGVTAKFQRTQFLYGMQIMGSNSMNDLSLTVLAVNKVTHEGHNGNGITVGLMQGKLTKGWRIQFELSF